MKYTLGLHKLFDLLYPPFCITCKEPSSSNICSVCAHEIEFIDPIDRCPLCFHERPTCETSCLFCERHPVSKNVFGQASCLHTSHVMSQLLEWMSHRIHWDLEAACASLAYMQLNRLKWPDFDLLLIEPTHWILPNQKTAGLIKRIGKQLSLLLKIPYLQARLDPLSVPVPYLPLEQQVWHDELQMTLPSHVDLTGKKILTFSLKKQRGTTWQTFSRSLYSKGLMRVWNLALVEEEFSSTPSQSLAS